MKIVDKTFFLWYTCYIKEEVLSMCIDCYKKCVGCEYFVDGDYYNPPECSADVCALLEDKKEEER